MKAYFTDLKSHHITLILACLNLILLIILYIIYYPLEEEKKSFNFDEKFNIMIPDIVNFLYWCRENKTNEKLFFVSRDGYILQKMYQKLFPEDKTEYIYSSRICYKEGENYKKYLNSLGKGTFVDVQGTNRSHINFFKKYNQEDPQKLLLGSIRKNKDENNCKIYNSGIKFTEDIYGYELEFMFKAPHRRILNVEYNKNNNNYEPVYESKESYKNDPENF